MSAIQELEVEKYFRPKPQIIKFEDIKKAHQSVEPTLQCADEDKEKEEGDFITFTEKEVMKMPKKLRILIRELNCVVFARKRTTGRYNRSYEIRFNRGGYNISASGQTVDIAKKRFIEKAKAIEEKKQSPTAPPIPTSFNDFALYWFENFHKRKVIEKTYNNNLSLYNRHLKEKFKGFTLSELVPAYVQGILDGLPGNGKTADDAFSILNQIFDTAVIHKKLDLNPLKLFPHKNHECENGVELTQDEEIKLLTESKGTVYQTIFAVLLYCGLRPNEYKTAHIEGKFIVAVNSKRKNGKVEYKKIPICNALMEIIKDIQELPKRHDRNIAQNYKKILPNHTLKDLRKTFSTRCVNLHVDFYARKKFMGHSVGKLDKPYVGDIDDYLLTEGKKLNDWYSVPQKYPKFTPNS